MKVAIVSGENSATTEVMKRLIPGLRRLGAQVELFIREKLSSHENFHAFDIVHFGYLLGGLDAARREIIVPPITGNVWHIPYHRVETYTQLLLEVAPTRIFVDDITTLQTLGFVGFTEVTPVPLVFDAAKFSHLPTPATPFTVGAFGNNYESKRFEVIREGCKLAGVEFFDMVQPQDGRIHALLDPIQDVYTHVHALAHASFIDTNFLPGLEAIACGRPILTTHNYGIERVLRDGVNGFYYDGSPEDLARRIKDMKNRYDSMAEAARGTIFPSPSAAAQIYFDTFTRILEEASPDDRPDQRLQNLLIA